MSIAFLSAQRSKDPSTQVGACIVNKENKVVGIGYNGMPTGCSDDIMPWNKNIDTDSENWLNSKLPYVCHAELNAVLNKNCADVKDCIIYVALFPCNLCAQIIIQSRLSEVVYYCDKEPGSSETKAAKYLFDLAGIPYRQFVPNKPTVEIDFSLIEVFGKETTANPGQQTVIRDPKSKNILEIKSNISQPLGSLLYVDNCCSKDSQKRHSYLQWNEYFMAMAFLSAQRSKDPRTQVGACIVNKDKKIVGIGYNGMPIGCCDDIMPWNRATDKSDAAWLESKSPYVCHAELNAVLNKNSADIKGCTIYVALFPCNKCAQVVVQSGISEVIYYSDKYHDVPDFKASRHLLSTAGVTYTQFRPRQEKIIIDFGMCDTTGNHCSESDLVKDASETANCSDKGNVSKACDNVNNNNISIKHSSQFLLQDNIGLITHNDVAASGQLLQESLEIGWVNEVKELRCAFLSFAVAAGVAVLSWFTSSSNFYEFANF